MNAETEAATEAQEPKVDNRRKFSDEQIAEIRQLRAENDEHGRPKYSHAALAKQFDTRAGVISQIVRNMTYKDPNYVPTNDMLGTKAEMAQRAAAEAGAEGDSSEG